MFVLALHTFAGKAGRLRNDGQPNAKVEAEAKEIVHYVHLGIRVDRKKGALCQASRHLGRYQEHG